LQDLITLTAEVEMKIALGTNVKLNEQGLEILRAVNFAKHKWPDDTILTVVDTHQCDDCGTHDPQSHPENCASRFYTLELLGNPKIRPCLADSDFSVIEETALM
jgi:hypothetical protein